ncbi:MAG: hypothetical protein QOG49_885, partial [Frankiaceae bacterium]|nr:hypothetical protein [Frankiaceae bacterium]
MTAGPDNTTAAVAPTVPAAAAALFGPRLDLAIRYAVLLG